MAETFGPQLPVELAEQVIFGLEEYVPHERLTLLTSESIKNIKNARLQGSAWRFAAWRSFAKIIGQTPFHPTRASMQELENLSKLPDLCVWVETLTFSGKAFRRQIGWNELEEAVHSEDPDIVSHQAAQEDQFLYVTGLRQRVRQQRYYRARPQPEMTEFEQDLARILARFPNLKHLRYVRSVKGHLKGWSGVATLSPKGFYMEEGKSCEEGGTEGLFKLSILNRVAKALAFAGVKIESLTTPFMGKEEPERNALVDANLVLFSASQPLAGMLRNLHTLAINFNYGEVDSLDLSNVLSNLHSVRTLELAISNTTPCQGPRSRKPMKDIWATFKAAQMIDPRTGISESPQSLANLEELRVSFTTADLMDGEKMVGALRRLPKLRRLALGYACLATAYVTLATASTILALGQRHDWATIATLCGEWMLLDKLLLIEPLEGGSPMAYLGSDGGEFFLNLKNAAGEVKVLQDQNFAQTGKLERYMCFRDVE
ncbi:hypothetical protein BU16DRAFT_534535 [Lophium mytilinum]|uniref:Uncharacterized protein n=1 Tax=Lophium mytilinum TaxID=390894 RepID=A0A6A6RDU0_9PEZI|nr:hypothetical protein BU16DRAFT_534535 [Lophium mytilinum]